MPDFSDVGVVKGINLFSNLCYFANINVGRWVLLSIFLECFMCLLEFTYNFINSLVDSIVAVRPGGKGFVMV